MCYEDISDVLPVDPDKIDVDGVDATASDPVPSLRDRDVVICHESFEWLGDLVHDELMLL
jgi:hypothetical protein